MTITLGFAVSLSCSVDLLSDGMVDLLTNVLVAVLTDMNFDVLVDLLAGVKTEVKFVMSTPLEGFS